MQSYEQTGRRRDEGRGSSIARSAPLPVTSTLTSTPPLTNSPLPVMPGPAPGLFSEQRGEEKRRWQMGRRLLTRPEQLLQSVSPRQRELNAVSGVALAKEEEVKAEEIKRRLRLFYVARSFLV